LDRSKDWMDEADGDLEHAKSDSMQGFYNWACFSAQQSAEKAVKAVFQKMHAEAWGHSVADLLQELSTKLDVPSDLIDAALELDKAYIPTRYPNAHPSGSPRRKYTKDESKRLVEYAQRIFKFCTGILSQV
jgi:HEPN domain-containing protein